MYKNKISAVYQIINTVTNDRYVGSSNNVMQRWAVHKAPSVWKEHPNSPLYLDMQKYGVDKFRFQILAPVMEGYLKQVEQEFIEMLKPTYNDKNAKGLDIERRKETKKEYNKEWQQTDKGRESHRKSSNKYSQSEKGKEALRKYQHQLCCYNDETLTLDALRCRFKRAGVEHPFAEAKKYLIND